MSAVSGIPAERGRFVDVGARRLRIVCEGPPRAAPGGPPAVVLEAGAFGFAADWSVVQQKLAAKGVRSCAYDRAGLGFSDPGPEPRDGLAVAGDLEALLQAAGEPGPYVLVGHSMAGLYVRLFTARNPGKVAGVVLVDAATPEAAEHPELRNFVGQFATLSNLAGWGASFGLFKPFAGAFGDKIGVTEEALAEKRWAFGHGPHNRAAALEVEQWLAASEQAAQTGRYAPALPVAVVTAGSGNPDWQALQAAPARASLRGHVENVAAAGHADLLGLKHADAIVRAIDHVMAAIARPSAPAAE